jgi:hypothetical protein
MLLNNPHNYLLWHYSLALKEIWHIFKNFFWFTTHLFSIPQLSRSLFSPWKRLTEEKGRGFGFEQIAGYIIINLLSRLIGALIRSVIILAGISALLFLSIGLLVFYTFWLIAPAMLLTMLYYGLVLLFV